MQIVFINRKSRQDRRENLISRLARFGLKADRFNAIEDNFFLNNNSNLDNRALGCYHSHFCIYKLIKSNQWAETLILEDDCDFASDFLERLNKRPLDYDIIHLGLSDEGNGYYNDQTKWLGHAYLVNLKAIEKIIEHTETIERAIDHQLFFLQEKLKIYDIRPKIAWQDGSRSDLR